MPVFSYRLQLKMFEVLSACLAKQLTDPVGGDAYYLSDRGRCGSNHSRLQLLTPWSDDFPDCRDYSLTGTTLISTVTMTCLDSMFSLRSRILLIPRPSRGSHARPLSTSSPACAGHNKCARAFTF